MIKGGWDRKSKKLMPILKSLVKRIEKVQSYLVHQLALEIHTRVQSRIPFKPQYDTYRNNLKTARLPKSKKYVAYAVYYDHKAVSARRVEDSSSIIIVRKRKRFFGHVPDYVQVLAKWSPWTVDTIPFIPDKKVAVVLYREVTKRGAASVAEHNRENESRWRADLQKAGLHASQIKIKKSKPDQEKLRSNLVVDSLYQAVQMEFGLGGVRHQPHWKPVLRDVMGMVKLIALRSEIRNTFSNPTYNKWRRFPYREKNIIGPVRVKRFHAFQSKFKV